jgi:hypothetical protein
VTAAVTWARDPEVRWRISRMWRSSAGSSSWLVTLTISTSSSGAMLLVTLARPMLVWSLTAPSALRIVLDDIFAASPLPPRRAASSSSSPTNPELELPRARFRSEQNKHHKMSLSQNLQLTGATCTKKRKVNTTPRWSYPRNKSRNQRSSTRSAAPGFIF